MKFPLFLSTMIAILAVTASGMLLINCDLSINKNDNKSRILELLPLSGPAPVNECNRDSDCLDNKVCTDHKCVQRPMSHCENLGGYCDSAFGECAETYIMWTCLGCPGGN